MRFATALGIDDLLRACTYESVYDGDAEILSRRFGEEKSESARQNVCLSEAVLARRARARSIGKTRVSRSAPKKCETQIYRSVLTVSAPCRTRPSWFACEWHHRLARFPTQGDAEPRSEGAVARLGVGRIHWKFDGLTEEGRQAQLSPKVRCRESSTAVRALASAFKTRKIKKNIEARVSFGIESIGKRPPITVAPSAD